MNEYLNNEILIQIYKQSGLKKLEFSKLIKRSDSFTSQVLRKVRVLTRDKLKEIQNILKQKEMRIGSLVQLSGCHYPNDKYNPRDLTGFVIRVEENRIIVTWENGINNSYSKSELILILK